MDSVYHNLYYELNKADICLLQLAEALDTTEIIVYDKLRGNKPWLLSDAIVICRLLNTSDVNYLFYN